MLKKGMSLRAVVISGVVAGLIIPMSIGTFYELRQQHARLVDEAQNAHDRVTAMMALGVQKALWDLSPEAAAPMVKSAIDDPRVVSVAIFDNKNTLFHEAKDESRRAGTIRTLDKPVKNGEDTIGKVTVEFSMGQVTSQMKERMVWEVILAMTQAAACIAILILLLNRRVLARIDAIKSQAQMIATRQLDTPFDWKDSDEIGTLGRALESTRNSLRGLFSEIERKNADLARINGNLERLVAERTATIKMIMDHVKSGFLLVDRTSAIQDGYSKSCMTLLGRPQLGGVPLPEALGLTGRTADHLLCCIDQVFDDLMPEAVTLDQVAGRFKIGGRIVSTEGSTIRNEKGIVEQMLLTVVDVTLLDQVEKENRTNRAMVRIMQNIEAFSEFIRDSRSRILASLGALKTGRDAVVRRELHTLKGNSSAFGLEDIARLIHQVEDQVSINDQFIVGVEQSFARFLEDNFELLKIKFNDEPVATYHVSENAVLDLEKNVSSQVSLDAVKNVVSIWSKWLQRVPAGDLIGPLGDYVTTLSSAKGKSVAFRVVGGEMRIERKRLKDVLQNLVHLVRNSVDHGVESVGQRGQKSGTGHLTISFKEVDDGLHIEVSDDGRGIDEGRVAEKAIESGKITRADAAKLTRTGKLNLIFLDGLSTAEAVSETSGRGVGMSAVKDSVERVGGSIEIETALGIGTTFLIKIPDAAERHPIASAQPGLGRHAA